MGVHCPKQQPCMGTGAEGPRRDKALRRGCHGIYYSVLLRPQHDGKQQVQVGGSGALSFNVRRKKTSSPSSCRSVERRDLFIPEPDKTARQTLTNALAGVVRGKGSKGHSSVFEI